MRKSQFEKLRLMMRSEGITASELIEMARPKDSPFHDLFEWDNKKAAHEFRLMQARNLIRTVNVFIDKDPEISNSEKLVNVPTDSGKGEGTYKEMGTVVRNIGEFERALSMLRAKLNAASRAVHELESVAHEEDPNTAAVLALAMRSIDTANNAIATLH